MIPVAPTGLSLPDAFTRRSSASLYTCLTSIAPTGLFFFCCFAPPPSMGVPEGRGIQRREAVQQWHLLCKEIFQKPLQFQNLCIFAPDCSGKQSERLKAICTCIRLINLENLGNGYKIRVSRPNLYSNSYTVESI